MYSGTVQSPSSGSPGSSPSFSGFDYSSRSSSPRQISNGNETNSNPTLAQKVVQAWANLIFCPEKVECRLDDQSSNSNFFNMRLISVDTQFDRVAWFNRKDILKNVPKSNQFNNHFQKYNKKNPENKFQKNRIRQIVKKTKKQALSLLISHSYYGESFRAFLESIKHNATKFQPYPETLNQFMKGLTVQGITQDDTE